MLPEAARSRGLRRSGSSLRQSNDILASEVCNRAFQDGEASCPFTDFPSEPWSHLRIRRLTHQAKRLADALFGDQAEKRRLFELDRQALVKGSVENRVSGLIDEIRQDDGVTVGELWRGAKDISEQPNDSSASRPSMIAHGRAGLLLEGVLVIPEVAPARGHWKTQSPGQ